MTLEAAKTADRSPQASPTAEALSRAASVDLGGQYFPGANEVVIKHFQDLLSDYHTAQDLQRCADDPKFKEEYRKKQEEAVLKKVEEARQKRIDEIKKRRAAEAGEPVDESPKPEAEATPPADPGAVKKTVSRVIDILMWQGLTSDDVIDGAKAAAAETKAVVKKVDDALGGYAQQTFSLPGDALNKYVIEAAPDPNAAATYAMIRREETVDQLLAFVDKLGQNNPFVLDINADIDSAAASFPMNMQMMSTTLAMLELLEKEKGGDKALTGLKEELASLQQATKGMLENQGRGFFQEAGFSLPLSMGSFNDALLAKQLGITDVPDFLQPRGGVLQPLGTQLPLLAHKIDAVSAHYETMYYLYAIRSILRDKLIEAETLPDLDPSVRSEARQVSLAAAWQQYRQVASMLHTRLALAANMGVRHGVDQVPGLASRDEFAAFAILAETERRKHSSAVNQAMAGIDYGTAAPEFDVRGHLQMLFGKQLAQMNDVELSSALTTLQQQGGEAVTKARTCYDALYRELKPYDNLVAAVESVTQPPASELMADLSGAVAEQETTNEQGQKVMQWQTTARFAEATKRWDDLQGRVDTLATELGGGRSTVQALLGEYQNKNRAYPGEVVPQTVGTFIQRYGVLLQLQSP